MVIAAAIASRSAAEELTMPTPNLGLATVGHLALPGAWDTPTNNNWGIVDNIWGGVASIAVSNVDITLTSTQAQQQILLFTGTLFNSITIHLPSVGSHHVVINATDFTADKTIILRCGGGLAVAVPQNDPMQIVTDGSNVYYVGLERIGSYVDFASTDVPIWITNCDVPPYLRCDGSTFNPVTYPILASQIGTTLPDASGRARYSLNNGSGRLIDNLNGDVLFADGGNEHTQQHNHVLHDPGHAHGFNAVLGLTSAFAAGPNGTGAAAPSHGNTDGAATGISIDAYGSGNSGNMPPAYVGGITMIRAG